MHTLFRTGYTREGQVIFCALLSIFTNNIRPHQIQCPGVPEHPINPPGLPEINHWEPRGSLKNLEEFLKISTLFHTNISPWLLGFPINVN